MKNKATVLSTNLLTIPKDILNLESFGKQEKSLKSLLT